MRVGNGRKVRLAPGLAVGESLSYDGASDSSFRPATATDAWEPLAVVVASTEERYLEAALAACRWNVRDVSRLLRVPYGTLWKKLKRYGLTRSTARPMTGPAPQRGAAERHSS